MPRRRVITKRSILPDPKFNSVLLARFINCVMRNGKKSVAEAITYGALDKIWEKAKNQQHVTAEDGDNLHSQGEKSENAPEDPVAIFTKALENIKPAVEVRSRRVGGATYQIPVEIIAHRRVALAMRWLISAAQERTEKTMVLRLAGEILDALNSRGAAIEKCKNIHRMAKANQAFAYFHSNWN